MQAKFQVNSLEIYEVSKEKPTKCQDACLARLLYSPIRKPVLACRNRKLQKPATNQVVALPVSDLFIDMERHQASRQQVSEACC